MCRDHYQKNKPRYAERNAKARRGERDFVAWLKEQPCVDCGQSYPYYCMDFDHARGEKKFEISRASGANAKKLLEELVKCDVVCAICHRKRTVAKSASKTGLTRFRLGRRSYRRESWLISTVHVKSRSRIKANANNVVPAFMIPVFGQGMMLAA